MTVAEARQILEDFDHAEQAWHECRAEAGMGAVSMGWSGYDGMSVFGSYNPAPQPDADVLAARALFAELPNVLQVYPGNDRFSGRHIQVWGPGPMRLVSIDTRGNPIKSDIPF